MTNAGAGMIGIMWRMDIWCGNQGIPPRSGKAGRKKENMMKKYEINDSVDNFAKVFTKLMQASYSVNDSVFANADRNAYIVEVDEPDRKWYKKELEEFCTEGFVVDALARNVLFDRTTGNSVGWGECGIDISAFGVEYTTCGGLVFGWDVYPQWSGDDYVENTLTVYCYAREGGTLEKSLVEHGFVAYN